MPSSSDIDRQTVILAALLHDIGKFRQRASDYPQEKTHQEFGADWIKDNFSEEIAHKIAACAQCHHALQSTHPKAEELSVFKNPSNLTLTIYQADNLSAKERKKELAGDYSEWQTEIALPSIFSWISLNHQDIKPKYNACWKYLPFQPVSNNITFPNENTTVDQESYKNLWQCYETEFANIKSNPCINNILVLLEKYCSTIPSFTLVSYDGFTKEQVKEKQPDVSLFDHLKTTAAIAAVMWNYLEETYSERWKKNELFKNEILNEADEKYLLLGGDLSGVQDFIYTIGSAGALRSLRARSFFI
ncbi:MAG: type III-A CRISPR-associated protein Cas10/Csm1, partial [bacterium]|nr:type III-A CRISPR-associated protein Cas10/Csm1 [bacterium]